MKSELRVCTMCTRGGGWNGRWMGRCSWGMALGLLALELALVLSSFFAPCSAQEDFLSIDCGSEVNYTDSVTGLQWVTDSSYISLGTNSPRIDNKTSTHNTPTQPLDARFFTEERSKYCYILPVEADATYLVRSTFLLEPLAIDFNYTNVIFDVYVNSTFWVNINYGGTPLNPGLGPTERRTLEMIFRSRGRVVSVCLKGVLGFPFISSLALRKLGNSLYPRVTEAAIPTALFVYFRYNFGVEARNGNFYINYPDDEYDRVWENFGPSKDPQACPAIITSTAALSSTPQNASENNQPPTKVMESACTSATPDSAISLTLDFTAPLQMYYAVLYLQEINSSVTSANPRGMSVDAINIKTETVNITSNVTQLTTPPTNLSSLKFSVDVSRLSTSTLGPIINAAEFSGEEPLNMSSTSPSDVVAINELQEGFYNLVDWTGDPCYPVSWNWINCNYALTPARISEVWLSNQSLSGSIAPGISGLTQLTILMLDHNHLNGSIPDLQNLTNLQLLHLQTNNLTGAFPGYLFGFPNLTQLYVQNNNLSGAVPDCQTHSDLTYGCEGNSRLQRCRPGLRSCSSGSGGYSARTVWIVVGASLGGVALVTFVVGLLVCLLRSRRRMKQASAPNQRPPVKPVMMPQKSMMFGGEERDRATAFTFEQMVEATNSFTDKIGEGSFGPVYRGKLPGGREIAVKTNAGSSRQGTAEFVNEVNLLSRVHHKNLVSLLGFCEERAELILVYDYMANGTVREHLYSLPEGRIPMSWATRLNVAISAAKGLEYLHTACTPRIIHRDVKSSNILLDDQMVAKVADFGLSKSGADLGFTSGFSTVIKGTPGYFDPEYFVTKKLTLKSDVYSFGVVLLEIVCGRPPYPSEVPDGTIQTLPEWMHSTINTDIFAIVDPALEGRYNEESMRKVIELAAECLEQRNIRRPDSTEVVVRLNHARDLEPSASSRVRRSLDSNILNSPFEPSGSVSSFSALINTNASAAYMSTDISYNEGR